MKLGRWVGIARLAILALVIGVVVVGLAQAQTSAPSRADDASRARPE